MSFLLFTHRLVRHGRYFLQTYCKRDIYTSILEHGKSRVLPLSEGLPKAGVSAQNIAGLRSQNALRNSTGIFRFAQYARRLFVDNVLNQVTSSYSAELRSQAVKKFFYGDSVHFFALIGVSLASGAGVLTKEDELEGVCWEIREAAMRYQNNWSESDVSPQLNPGFSLDKLNIGPPIAKGCAAVVYSASLKTNADSLERIGEIQLSVNSCCSSNQTPGNLPPIQNISRFVHNFGSSADNLHLCSEGVNIDRVLSAPDKRDNLIGFSLNSNHPNGDLVENIENDKQTGFETPSTTQLNSKLNRSEVDFYQYPFALKMLFNYDIQSNAMSILRAMYKETIPAKRRWNDSANGWEQLLSDQTLSLPPHPNIVRIHGVFCADVPNLSGNLNLYPMALPQRINPQGFGRNMSLFLLMKRYDCCLRDYLDSSEFDMRKQVFLFAQLLEAVAHLSQHGIAHRDLKSDNILIDIDDDSSTPVLVVSDFGCCLADKVHGLRLPYTSHDIDKGGNTALMAPEIINKAPGTFSILDYSKSDLWACGAIAYEIFGHQNPFYPSGMCTNSRSLNTKTLKNVNYKQGDLPEINPECPPIVKQLILNILSPSAPKRLSPDIAANVMQLYLWAPSAWLRENGMPSSPEILQWLLSLTTKVICEGRNGTNAFNSKTGRRTYTEYLLISSFLARARLRRIRSALSWIQNAV